MIYINEIANQIKSFELDLKELGDIYSESQIQGRDKVNINNLKIKETLIIREILQDHLIKLNVGGCVFFCSPLELLSIDNTFFTEIFLENFKEITMKYKEKMKFQNNDFNKDDIYALEIGVIQELKNEFSSSKFDLEIFIDRNPKVFHFIIEYLNNKNLNLFSLSDFECKLLLQEAEFYDIDSLVNLLSRPFKGTNKIVIKDYKVDKPLKKIMINFDNIDNPNNEGTGIAVMSNGGSITLNFDKEYAIAGFNIRGIINSPYIQPTMGRNASITINGKGYGILPSNYGKSIITYNLVLENNGQRVLTDSIKFTSFNNNLGIGYISFF